MSQTQRIEIDGRSARVIDTDGGQTVVLDLGADVSGSVEVLGETVLVVTDSSSQKYWVRHLEGIRFMRLVLPSLCSSSPRSSVGHYGDQHDIDLGAPIERAYLNNGILTIEYGGQV
ncbi:MAG: hypothetical protein ACLFR6_03730 [Salinarchaeum sp.]